MIIKIGKKHINSEANPLRAALVEAGFSEIHFEIYLNLLPPRHDWKIHIDGTRLRHDLWIAVIILTAGELKREAHAPSPAHLILDRRDERTADIRVIRIPKGAPPWVHADMTLTEWRAMLKENEIRAAEDRRNGYRPTSPASLSAELDALPDGHWLKAKRKVGGKP